MGKSVSDQDQMVYPPRPRREVVCLPDGHVSWEEVTGPIREILTMSDNGIYIEGFALVGYRSFGKELQLIGPFSRLNLFIGANNSGKSNILRFLHRHYIPALNALGGQSPRIGFEVAMDRHRGGDF
jgi:hypothetical protein